jgi:hypothetical protein
MLSKAFKSSVNLKLKYNSEISKLKDKAIEK